MPQGFQLGFGGHVCQGQALATRFVGVLCVVFAQGLFDFQGQCVLAFNAIGVVRVHGTQQLAQARQRRNAADDRFVQAELELVEAMAAERETQQATPVLGNTMGSRHKRRRVVEAVAAADVGVK